MPSPLTAFLRDPRQLQIAFLASFLVAGVGWLGFDVPLWQPPLIALTACATQAVMTRLMRAPPVGLLSPLVTSLGLSLLLRTDAAWVGPFAAAVAISSKFLLRTRGKHLFNPTNLGLVVAMLLTPHAWCSPSQWGHGAVLWGWFAAFGLAVAHRAFRSDVSLAFLGTWVLLKAARVFYLGAPWTSLQHQLSAGGLILFTFFMISDPKTTPDHRAGRILFAMSVAGLAFVLLHGLWWQNALVWALCLLSPLTPLIDRLLPSDRFQWPAGGGLERTDACASPASQPA
jgi:enediyne biosynthesis protein E5